MISVDCAMSKDCIDTSWPIPVPARPNIRGSAASSQLLTNLVNKVAQWQERARGRHLLQQLDDRMLHDVGLSRSDVDCECAKHFWQR
jgi:uncharacterized protein YjiS (DUF1127 family)